MEEVVIEIPQYDEHIVISKKRRPKYKINADGESVVSNTRTVGKEKKWKINGQSIYVGMNPNLRAKVMKEMKKYLYKYIRPIPNLEDTPICIELEIHNVPGVKNKYGEIVRSWDLGNQEFIWLKCFEDALCGNVDFESVNINSKIVKVPMREQYPAKLLDDSVLYLNKRICSFYPVDDTNDRKLVFKIKTNND